MAVTTWSFNSGYEGWTFTDISADISLNPCPACFASRSYVAGAMRTRLFLDNLANVSAVGRHTSPTGLNATAQNGDTIEVDYSATSDAGNTNVEVYAVYTDTSTETNNVVSSGAGTLTLTLTQNKVIDYIIVRDGRSTGGSGVGSDSTRDILEVRMTTTAAVSATPGKLTLPSTFLEGGGGGGASGAQGSHRIASIDADGTYIYIAAFNNFGFPTLIKILADLSADGTVVFDPGAGSQIGVQCGAQDADVVWVAGAFDGTNVVEKSVDAGANFTVKDDGTMGAIRAFTVGPFDDNRVIVFDDDNDDILETINDGATWTTIQAGITPQPNTIDRLAFNPQECVFGNDGAVTDSIDYSPNSGADLEDYQIAPFPNTNVSVVIVN